MSQITNAEFVSRNKQYDEQMAQAKARWADFVAEVQRLKHEDDGTKISSQIAAYKEGVSKLIEGIAAFPPGERGIIHRRVGLEYASKGNLEVGVYHFRKALKQCSEKYVCAQEIAGNLTLVLTFVFNERRRMYGI